MKIARFFAVIFACIGTILLLGSLGFLLMNRNADVRVQELPQEAVSVSENFAQALNDGDLASAAGLMYGQPDLGVSGNSADSDSALVWEAFCSSISFEFTGTCQVEQNSLVRKGSITALDVSNVLEVLPQKTQNLLNQRIAAAEDLAEIYDEKNEFRQELVEEILQEALQQVLAQDAKNSTREVTLKLISRDGSWWVVPDQALLQVLSGLA